MDKTPSFGALRRAAALAPTKPDYGTWSLKETWSISEGAKLVCGRNPYDKIPGPQQFNKDRRVIDIIDASFAAAQKGDIKIIRSALLPIHLLVEPASFVRWAVAEGLTMPEELNTLATPEVAPARIGAEFLIKDRVTTIARTLWFIDPTLTDTEVATHRAMRELVSEAEALMTDKLRWISESR